MKKNTGALITVIMFMTAFILFSCSENKDQKVKKLFESRCSTCHGLDSTKAKSLSAQGWRDLTEDMIKKGARLNDTEKEALVKYLAAQYGE